MSRFVQSYKIPKIDASPDTTLDKGLGILLNVKGAEVFHWLLENGLNDPTIKNPYCNATESTTYIVEGTDSNGCKNTDTLKINVRNDFLVFPYNVITPDENGLNDVWYVKNIETYPQNHVIIFNQWNQTVFEKDSYQNEWEGKNQSGDILPDATYYYILSFENSTKKYSGYITLIRNRK